MRFNSSSGGLTKAFLSFLVDSGEVDEAIFVRMSYPKVEVVVSGDKNEWLTPKTNSIYVDVDPLSVEKDLDANKKYAITLLPCGVRKLREIQSTGRLLNISVVIGLLCNHTRTPEWIPALIEKLGVNPKEVRDFRCRGDGPIGVLRIELHNGEVKTKNRREIWDNHNIDYMNKKCRSCRLFEAETADMVVGDPWGIKNCGPGKTLTKVNNENTNQLLKLANNYLVLESFSKEEFERTTRGTRRSKNERCRRSGVEML